MNEGMKALEKSNMWEMVDLSRGNEPIICKWCLFENIDLMV